jgi:hypothetical protein
MPSRIPWSITGEEFNEIFAKLPRTGTGRWLEDAVRTLSLEPSIRSVRWQIQHEAAAEWTGKGNIGKFI